MAKLADFIKPVISAAGGKKALIYDFFFSL